MRSSKSLLKIISKAMLTPTIGREVDLLQPMMTKEGLLKSKEVAILACPKTQLISKVLTVNITVRRKVLCQVREDNPKVAPH